MDTENPFTISDWISKYQSWATAPPKLKKIVAEYFLIPQELEFDLLPSPHLSIARMLDFPLPLQSSAMTGSQPAQFFSKELPDISDRDLQIRLPRLSIPDAKTIRKLLAGSRQRFVDGFRSVLYSHVGSTASHYLLWILTYWEAVSELKGDAWANFRKSQEWLNRQKKIAPANRARAALAEDAAVKLAMLPWGVRKRGLSDSEPFHMLWRFLGPNWLSGAGMNDMAELLRHKINTDAELVKSTRVWGTALVPKILEAYRAAETGTYWITRDLRWIRDIADDLVQSRAALITSAHLGPVTKEPHWVAIVSDCRDKPVVRYGDSLKAPISRRNCLPLAVGGLASTHQPLQSSLSFQSHARRMGIRVEYWSIMHTSISSIRASH
ncbi:hypothetical protein K438DRAFT_2141717 [Mycena galopus ATCC 62051]|nr:hypothetical protein K438DRAFT_2141717 [Mycena galopus ATCC 62051]